jgi:aerobic-type carbon monoxide dehydrogenase small subunit (CoxS/CutS family)
MQGSITINGRPRTLTFDGGDTLLDVLRAAGYTEVKRGCAHGECGSCLVLLDGVPVNACQVYAAAACDRTVTTSRGLSGDGSPHVIHRAFAESGAVQCGYCTPGMTVAAFALLQEDPHPDEAAIRSALSGNICRCTGYVKVIEAVRRAAERMGG